MGKEFIKKLLEMGEVGVRAAIVEATEEFRHKYKVTFAGEERYWEQALVLADLAAKLAKDWGLIAFDHKGGIEWVLSQIGAIRRIVAEAKIDAFDLLAEYLNVCASMQVQIFHTAMQKPTMDYNRIPRGEIRVRFDFYRKSATAAISNGTVMLDRAHLRRWLSTRGADYKSFVQEFTMEGIIATPKTGKVYMAKDTPVKLAQAFVVGLNLSHPRLKGMLTDADEALDSLKYDQLRAVS